MEKEAGGIAVALAFSSDRCWVIAHRGASAYYPENTMPAFRAAVQMGADMLELDVMLSRDHVPVVFHDARLNAHTNGTGLLQNHTLRQLRQLDAGSWFDDAFAGETIPTLEEVLSFASQKIAVNIEIKPEAAANDAGTDIVEKCLKVVRNNDMLGQVLFSSFAYRVISRLKELEPTMPAALLFNKRQSQKRLPHELVQMHGADAFNCSYRQLTGGRLADLKEYRIPTFIYTIDSKRRMKKLLRKGVSGIFTNKPDILRDLVNSSETRPYSHL